MTATFITQLIGRWRRFRCKHRDYRYRTERRQTKALYPEIASVCYCATCGEVLHECWGVDWEKINEGKRC